MKLTNGTGRQIIATLVGDTLDDVKTLVVEVDEPFETDDYVEASTLIEHGATADQVEIQAARELWAARNRSLNSRTASASASEASILGRRQATVDVSTGTASEPGPLKGTALSEAVKAANEAGAEIASTLTADEKRIALAAWQSSRGSSTPLDDDAGEEYLVDEDGELVVDGEGQPFALGSFEVDEDGDPVLDDDDLPVRKSDDDAGS